MANDNQECAGEPDWFEILAHTRSLFIYHAGQRLNSIRYFFAIYGVIFAGYLTVLRATDIDQIKPYALAAVALFGCLVALVYRMLDARNAELVEVDENAMHFVEQQILGKIGKQNCTSVDSFPNPRVLRTSTKNNQGFQSDNDAINVLGISKAMHTAPCSAGGYTYGKVMRHTFNVAIIVPLFTVFVIFGNVITGKTP